MTNAPELQRREIQDELGRIYQRTRRHHLVAVYGTGKEDVVNVDGTGEFVVVPVRSELELRERMPPLEDGDARIIFLVPWQGNVPLDLSGRFASTSIRCIDATRRLLSICGAREADDVGRSPLARYLLRPGNSGKTYPVAAGRVTEDALWAAWLTTDWGVDVSGGLARDTLLAWGGMDVRGGRFFQALDEKSEPAATGVRDALLGYLEKSLGPIGPVIWQAWEQGRGKALLEVALLCETLAPNEDGLVRVWLTEQLNAVLGDAATTQGPELAKTLGETAPLAFRVLERRIAKVELEGIVRSADARVAYPEIRLALVGNDRLPCAWTKRLERVGAALERGVDAPSVESVAEAAGALKALESHALFQETAHTRAVKRAEMAVRLLSWLVARPDQKIESSDADYADAIVLGRWYAEEGGFVDWARGWARGTEERVVGKGAQAVVAWADRERALLDARFTKALQKWIEAGRPSNQIVPIDQALKRFGAQFLEPDRSRRLLVLLMDGMAWAQAVQLLQSLGSRPHGWAPIAWHAMNRVGDGAYPVVLANLPTTTEVSRSAFFAGKEMPDGTTLNTQRDDERFRDNKQLHPFCDEAVGPRLLLRAEGHTGDGSASKEALSLIADSRRGIVGIVVNAIDASLKGDTQQQTDWTVETIRSLPDLLDAARDAGRTILLAADHGHVPGGLRTLSSPAQAGARYRPWLGDRDALQTGELLFKGRGVYTPKGAQGVVLLASEDVRYGGGAHSGEHGGATLAEVVAPCVLIGWDEPGPDALTDKARKPRPAYVPDWWHFAVRPAVEVSRTPKPPPVGTKRPKGVLEGQLGLPQLAPTVLPPIPVAHAVALAVEGPLVGFAECEMLKARAPKAALREQVVRAVELLLSRGGALAAEVFAQHLDVLPFRVEGYVRGLQEVLNVDGYAVLRLETRTRQVFLDKPKLEQQFEVKL
jgi:hypothetical protein